MPTVPMTHDCRACQDYLQVSRRRFMALSGAAAMLATVPAWVPRVAFARDGSSTPRDVVIQVYLRGGADGLSLVAPFSESRYYTMRPALALAQPDNVGVAVERRCLDLGQHGGVAFGLHPSLSALLPIYQAGQLLIVHATGLTNGSRSHFDAQRWMEQGQRSDPLGNTGWLGRHLASSPPSSPTAILRAMAIADTLQLTLAGAPQAIAAADPASVGFAGSWSTKSARLGALAELYAGNTDILRPAAQAVLNTLETLDEIDYDAYQPSGGAQYPDDDSLAYSLRASAALIKAQIGVEAVAIDVGGWDTHSDQGNFPGGHLHGLLRALGDALAAFHADMAGSSINYTLVVLSEFGRTASENGSIGTDHGNGNVMFAIGQGISGGRVLADWPGLQEAQLDDSGDLRTTIDYRDILAEIVQNRLGNADLASVFPGFTPTFRGATTLAG